MRTKTIILGFKNSQRIRFILRAIAEACRGALLELLIRATDMLHACGLLDKIHAAIAKAEGEK